MKNIRKRGAVKFRRTGTDHSLLVTIGREVTKVTTMASGGRVHGTTEVGNMDGIGAPIQTLPLQRELGVVMLGADTTVMVRMDPDKHLIHGNEKRNMKSATPNARSGIRRQAQALRQNFNSLHPAPTVRIAMKLESVCALDRWGLRDSLPEILEKNGGPRLHLEMHLVSPLPRVREILVQGAMMMSGRSSRITWMPEGDRDRHVTEPVRALHWNLPAKMVSEFRAGGANNQMKVPAHAGERCEVCFCIHAWCLELGCRVVTDDGCMTIR